MILALSAAHYRAIADLGFLGHDTVPIVVSSIVRSPHDVVDVFSEPHVGAPFWSLFYRPLLKLSFSFDHALYALDARGYHASTSLQLAIMAMGMFAFSHRIAGWLAAWVCTLVFLLHPVQVEVLPVLARRGDVLCGMFIALALCTQVSPRALTSGRPSLAVSLLTLAAVASKETALVLPVLIAALVFLWSPRAGVARARHALLVAVGPSIAVGVAALARLYALGSVGGHETAGVAALAQIGTLGAMLLLPQPVLAAWVWPIAALCFGAVLTCIAIFAARRQLPEGAGRGALFACMSIVVLLGIHAYTGKTSPWYLLLPAAAWAILLGVVATALASMVQRSRVLLARPIAAAALLSLGIFAIGQAKLSPVIHRYEEWRLAAASRDRYLALIDPVIEQASQGSVVSIGQFPNRVVVAPSEQRRRPAVPTAAIFRVDSLEAWFQARYPAKHIRVQRRGSELRRNAESLLLVAQPGIIRLP